MTLETLALGVIAGYFIWRLYQVIAKTQTKQSNKIRLVSKETGEVLEMKIIQKDTTPENEEALSKAMFVEATKIIFQQTLNAFATGNLKDLKKGLAPDVYVSFEQDIIYRRNNKIKMDFSLVCFDSIDVLNISSQMDMITVRFVTEQINLLKNEAGEVIEGDPMNIAIMQDIWVFQKVANNNWIIAATQSQACHA